ncbi:hypothetical protein ACRE_010630 [Hapsidospora chrysogenum ATCC 11550]|uniref:C3H1-type domain-containing protein n=1 Tax=Hapsidospora chrysogenum (strain ATCC 11550 / CBS 779.69 / DSM 880 / IAM 14645 / JCM 23072 / IMI 49137) TaxID=857340 RepID=A0A086TFK7_HAPC1|nr:hypothetical protein ACRE_010630 [Hapsidospora chrysogenum ATCC 11550]
MFVYYIRGPTIVPKPQFFIVRPHLRAQRGSSASDDTVDVTYGSTIVPLIPVDLLPDWIEIQGVPRQLGLEQTVGMTNLGSFPRGNEEVLRLKFHTVYQERSGADGYPEKEDHEERGSSTVASGESTSDEAPSSAVFRSHYAITALHKNTGDGVPTPSPPVPHGLAAIRHNGSIEATSHRGTASTTTSTSADSRQLHQVIRSEKPTTTPPGPGQPPQTIPGRKSTFQRSCPHWCRYGTCGFAETCYWRHVMPQTEEGLAEVGLDRFPKWYLDAIAAGRVPLGKMKKTEEEKKVEREKVEKEKKVEKGKKAERKRAEKGKKADKKGKTEKDKKTETEKTEKEKASPVVRLPGNESQPAAQREGDGVQDSETGDERGAEESKGGAGAGGNIHHSQPLIELL